MTELAELIQPNKAVRVFFGEGNVNNHVAHIRAIVDDEYVVYRVWLKNRRRWSYRVDHVSWFERLYQDDHLSEVT